MKCQLSCGLPDNYLFQFFRDMIYTDSIHSFEIFLFPDHVLVLCLCSFSQFFQFFIAHQSRHDRNGERLYFCLVSLVPVLAHGSGSLYGLFLEHDCPYNERRIYRIIKIQFFSSDIFVWDAVVFLIGPRMVPDTTMRSVPPAQLDGDRKCQEKYHGPWEPLKIKGLWGVLDQTMFEEGMDHVKKFEHDVAQQA